MTPSTHNLWVLITPAPAMPEQWVGHCLDLDIVSVGTSISQALAMTAEAVSICVGDDLANGRDPLSRPKAPESDWQMLRKVTNLGAYGKQPEDAKVIAATQFKLCSMTLVVSSNYRRPG